MKIRPVQLSIPVAALFLTATAEAPAAAAEPPVPFGEHVVHCAQQMGFSGDHNPGVHHQGFSNWQDHTC